MQQKADLGVYYHDLGQLIKAKREKMKRSQEQVARHLGFESRISIANIESGKQKIHVHTLAAIAGYLKTPIDELIPQLENYRKESSMDPELMKSLNKEGINSSASQLEGLMNKIRVD